MALDSLPQSVFEKFANKDFWEDEPHGVPRISGHRASKAAVGPISLFPLLPLGLEVICLASLVFQHHVSP